MILRLFTHVYHTNKNITLMKMGYGLLFTSISSVPKILPGLIDTGYLDEKALRSSSTE